MPSHCYRLQSASEMGQSMQCSRCWGQTEGVGSEERVRACMYGHKRVSHSPFLGALRTPSGEFPKHRGIRGRSLPLTNQPRLTIHCIINACILLLNACVQNHTTLC